MGMSGGLRWCIGTGYTGSNSPRGLNMVTSVTNIELIDSHNNFLMQNPQRKPAKGLPSEFFSPVVTQS